MLSQAVALPVPAQHLNSVDTVQRTRAGFLVNPVVVKRSNEVDQSSQVLEARVLTDSLKGAWKSVKNFGKPKTPPTEAEIEAYASKLQRVLYERYQHQSQDPVLVANPGSPLPQVGLPVPAPAVLKAYDAKIAKLLKDPLTKAYAKDAVSLRHGDYNWSLSSSRDVRDADLQRVDSERGRLTLTAGPTWLITKSGLKVLNPAHRKNEANHNLIMRHPNLAPEWDFLPPDP